MSMLPAGRNQARENPPACQLRMDGVVAALGCSRSHRGCRDRLRLRRHRVVAALAVGCADRMDRREVENVEAHRRDVGQPRDAIPNVPCWPGDRALAARHHLVPGAVARPRPVDHERKQLRARQVGPLWLSAMRGLQFVRQAAARLSRSADRSRSCRRMTRRGRSAGLRLGQQRRAFERIEGDVGAGLLLQLETVSPGREFVGPGLDGIVIAARLVRHEASAPAVVAVLRHRRAAPFAVVLAPPDQRGGDDIMAVAVDVGPHFDAFAGDPLDGIAAAVDQRIDVLDMESASRRSRQFELSSSR